MSNVTTLRKTRKTLEQRIEEAKTYIESRCPDFQYCGKYGEPGYSDPERGVLLANWNYFTRSFLDWLESVGFDLEWSDEWTIDYNNDKAYRTSPSSYHWESSVAYTEDGELLTPDDDDSVWIEEYQMLDQGHPPKCLPSRIPDTSLEAEGFVLAFPRLESGWFPGQTDDPKEQALKLFGVGAEAVVFRKVENSQFYIVFEAWVKWPIELEVVQFFNADGSFSHWSVVQVQNGKALELSTTVMHDTYLGAWREMRDLEGWL
jgi:hypothetical protein